MKEKGDNSNQRNDKNQPVENEGAKQPVTRLIIESSIEGQRNLEALLKDARESGLPGLELLPGIHMIGMGSVVDLPVSSEQNSSDSPADPNL